MNAFKFMKETSIPIKHQEVRTKILSLVNEIESLYKQHLRKSTGKTCDICGAGDDNEIYKVKDVVMGYEHRENLSPCLCHKHVCGWNASYVRCGLCRTGTSDKEIDLHFTTYLAGHLVRASKMKLFKQELT
jgi:hypothetical protein